MSSKQNNQPAPVTAPPHPRRRGQALENALLQAAWEEASTVGYLRLTMEGVATRAGTDKSVLYRRWPNRASLIRAAIRHHFGSVEQDIPDTGDLRQDLLSVLQAMRNTFQEIGTDIIRGLLAEQPDLPLDTFEVVPGVTRTILARNAARGHVTMENATPLITALPWALLRNKLMTTNENVPDSYLEEIIDDVFLPLVTRRRADGRRSAAEDPNEAHR